MPTKSSGLLMILQVLVGELGRILAGFLQIRLGVPAFEHDGEERRVHFARRDLGCLDVLGCFDQRDSGLDILGGPDLDSFASPSPESRTVNS
jgi:hypothetical protein